MIDRSFLPRGTPMVEWPDDEGASIRELCAPLSAMLDSPRGNHHEGKGRAFAAHWHRAKEERRAAAKVKPAGTRGKYA